ncbi:hypothetical protein EBZ39_15380 [bacterium]|nr:hypothetical protein [bacterium]
MAKKKGKIAKDAQARNMDRADGMDEETIETNLAGLHFMEKMVQAILSMKAKIRRMQDERGFTWNAWAGSYFVDEVLAEVGHCEEEK